MPPAACEMQLVSFLEDILNNINSTASNQQCMKYICFLETNEMNGAPEWNELLRQRLHISQNKTFVDQTCQRVDNTSA